MTFLSDFGYLESFWRYLRSKAKVVRNRSEFWTFFSLSQILGAGLPKVIHMFDTCLATRRMENVLRGYSH